MCEHGKTKYICKECGGSAICEHNIQRHMCRPCEPMSHVRHIAYRRIHSTLEGTGTAPSFAMLGCSVEEFKGHITAQLRDGMTWENYGLWHVDHITPLKYGTPTLEDTIARLHYTNTLPLWASENSAKGNKYVGRPGDEQHP